MFLSGCNFYWNNSFNAMWVINTIQASFPDIIPVLKTFEKGEWHRQRELKHLRKKSKKEEQSFQKSKSTADTETWESSWESPQKGRVLWSVSPAAYDGRWAWDTRVLKLIILYSSDARCLPHPDKYFWDWGQSRIHVGCQMSKHLYT